MAKGQALKKAEQWHVILITLADGPCPAKSVHLYCEGQYIPMVSGYWTCRLTPLIASMSN